jgi:medium-chain acyl-[acyl-carrier-protein] hydrolase
MLDVAALEQLWLARPRPVARPRLRLICFAAAGAGASVFHGWCRAFPEEIEVCGVKLPGREARLGEAPIGAIDPLVASLARALVGTREPFAFLGHSVGGLLCFEVARHLWREHGLCPAHLFLCATAAPDRIAPKHQLHQLPRERFVRALAELGGTPPEVLANDALLELLLPALRADFALSETYLYVPAEPLPVSATLLGGLTDPLAQRTDLEAWAHCLSGPIELEMLPGGHFFVQSAEATVLARVRRDCSRLLELGHAGPSPRGSP